MAAKFKSKSKYKSEDFKMSDIVDKFGITIREARDIATAVNNLALSKGSKKSRKDLVKQIKEVGTAVKKSEVGTTAGKVKKGKFKPGTARNYSKTFNVIDPKKKEKPVSMKKLKYF